MTETKIVEVSVYRQSASVRRLGFLPLKEGAQTVCLGGLTPSADQSSLRLSVPESVSGSNVQVVWRTQEERQAITGEVQKQIQLRESARALKEKQIKLWETNADFSQKESLSVAEMEAYLDKLPERLASLQAEIRALDEELKELRKQLEEKQKEASKPYVTAELSAAAAGTFPVELTYQESGANWYPAYEIHTEDGADELRMRLRAHVNQQSGEDWDGVKMSLFTGNPSVSGTIPKLPSAVLRFEEEKPVVQARMAKAPASHAMMMGMAMTGGAVAEEAVMYDMDNAMSMKKNAVMAGSGRAVKGETMTEYALDGKWDIRDGKEIICDIKEDRIACRYHVVTVPKARQSAFLAAEVKTADLEDLQNIEAAVYLKGTFAGNVVLRPDMTKDSYDLSLGLDESIKVLRQTKKRLTSSVLLKGQKKTEYEFSLTVSSKKEKPCEVLLTDQIPISEEKSITVEKGELSGGKLDEETGIVRWEFTVSPGESRTLKLGYTVAWPKDKIIEEVSRG